MTLRAGMGAVPGLRVDRLRGGRRARRRSQASSSAGRSARCSSISRASPSCGRSVQESAILSRINEEFPPERLLETLERVDPIGVLVGPPAIVPPPDAAIARDPDVDRAARQRRARHRHRVRARRRRLGLDRAAAASSSRTRTSSRASTGRASTVAARASCRRRVVAFDAQNDLAVLRVPGLRARRCRWPSPSGASPVALIGYPGNGPLAVHPGAARRDGSCVEPRRVRPRPGDADRDGDSRRGAAGALRRAGRGRARAACGRSCSRGGPTTSAATACRRRPCARCSSKVGREALSPTARGRGRACPARPSAEHVERGERLPERRDHVDAGGALA